jgi:hypothetical protein
MKDKKNDGAEAQYRNQEEMTVRLFSLIIGA